MNFIKNESSQKLRGGYYTPPDLACFLARWIKEINPLKILEPSCGDGAFFEALFSVGDFENAKIVGFELDKNEARKASKRAASCHLDSKIRAEDFLGWALNKIDTNDQSFDAVIGNPPFIRYQYLPAEFQEKAEKVFQNLDLPFTKHTNAWVPFVMASLRLLRPGGRLAMVLPAEIIHVMHAQSLRSYLGEECKRIVIVDPEELWFSDTLQGAVLLLAEKKSSQKEKAGGLGIYSASSRNFVHENPSKIFAYPKSINGKTVEGKWTRALLDRETREIFDELTDHPDVKNFYDIAEVDVGIVTGANKFFLVDNSTVEKYKLHDWTYPMFGRSEHCPGIIYDARQHRANATKGNPTNFVWFKDGSVTKKAAARKYIKLGEEQDLHTRYKCRVRKPWYSVPSVYSTEIGMLKRSHDVPRLILNRLGAYTTDTAYRIRTQGVEAEKLVSCFLNPLTALSAELEGRHYGGGVLELVPSEIERLCIPIPKTARFNIGEIDRQVRQMSAMQMLDRHGKNVLAAIGIKSANHEKIMQGWLGLRNRRHRVSIEIGDEELSQSRAEIF